MIEKCENSNTPDGGTKTPGDSKNNRKREPIGGGTFVYTTDEYRFGTDALVLAEFAEIKKTDLVCDLGCGGGIIPMIFCRDKKGAEIYGVDVQENACRIALAAAEENGFDNLKIINSDWSQIRGKLPLGRFSVVTCNPPYTKMGAGIVNPNTARQIARHEREDTLSSAVAAAASLLRSGGRFYICQRPDRLCDVIITMRENKLEPKRMRFVHYENAPTPWLVLVEGRKDGKPGMMIDPILSVNSDSYSHF